MAKTDSHRTIRFSTELIKSINTLAEKQERTFSSLIRIAVKEYIEKYNKEE